MPQHAVLLLLCFRARILLMHSQVELMKLQCNSLLQHVIAGGRARQVTVQISYVVIVGVWLFNPRVQVLRVRTEVEDVPDRLALEPRKHGGGGRRQFTAPPGTRANL